jgi:hypothetical protein
MRHLWTGTVVLGLLLAAGCGDDDNHNGNDAGPPDAALDASVIPDAQVDAYVPPPACDDGIDNDNDGLTDFPDDPGCSDASDMDEYNSPYCGTDGNGDPIEVREIPSSGHLVANTVHGSAWYEGSCGGGNGAGELIYRLTVFPGTAGFRISTDTDLTLFDTVVYVRLDSCDASSAEVACKDDTGDGVELNIDNPAPGTYYIFVDGADPGSTGQFGMEIQGLLGEGSPCDPSDDTMVCGTGMICIEPSPGDPTVCVLAQCSDGIDNDGDGIIDFPNEPGCETPLDHDESDTCPGVGCPECADGVDNDADGLTDWPDDPGCSGAGDLSELDECVTGLMRAGARLPASAAPRRCAGGGDHVLLRHGIRPVSAAGRLRRKLGSGLRSGLERRPGRGVRGEPARGEPAVHPGRRRYALGGQRQLFTQRDGVSARGRALRPGQPPRPVRGRRHVPECGRRLRVRAHRLQQRRGRRR